MILHQLYDAALLVQLSDVYKGRKKTKRTDWEKFSDLLIDKFANHSGTFSHLVNGVIEVKKEEDTSVQLMFFLSILYCVLLLKLIALLIIFL